VEAEASVQQLWSKSISGWLASLDQHRAHLEVRLQDALSSPSADAAQVAELRTERLRVADELSTLARYVRDEFREDRAANEGTMPTDC
jgi:hypothetical protein